MFFSTKTTRLFRSFVLSTIFSGRYAFLVGKSTSLANGIFVHVLENTQHVIVEFRLKNPETRKFVIASVTDMFSQFAMLLRRVTRRSVPVHVCCH